jgi:uncharacterized membrane protein YciS (DUF1049 family)
MKTLLRAIVFLAMLFVVLYIGLNNPKTIDFYFPLIQPKPFQAPAAIVFFAVFAVGVIAGIALGSGGDKAKAAPEGKRKD